MIAPMTHSSMSGVGGQLPSLPQTAQPRSRQHASAFPLILQLTMARSIASALLDGVSSSKPSVHSECPDKTLVEECSVDASIRPGQDCPCAGPESPLTPVASTTLRAAESVLPFPRRHRVFSSLELHQFIRLD